MSASVGAVFVAIALESKDLGKDRTHRAQWIELATLHPLEQPGELGLLRDRRLETAARTSGRDGEDLGREVAPPPLLELGRRAVGLDRSPELVEAGAGQCVGEDDR